MGVRNRGCFPLKYPHSIDSKLLSLYAQGLTIPDIVKKVGIPYETVRRRLREQGARPSAPRYVAKFGDIRSFGHCRHWGEEEEQKLRKLYPFRTNKDLAELFCCKEKQIKNKARSLGLKKDADWLLKKRLEAMKIANFCSKMSPNRFKFGKGNKFGIKFKKGVIYDREFWHKYKLGEVSLP